MLSFACLTLWRLIYSIPIDYVLNRLEEITVKNILKILGKPDLIAQYYWERYFYYPVDRFTSWERLEVLGYVSAYWQEYDIWVQIETFEKGKRQYTISAKDLAPLINKATYDIAVILSGYKSRVGKINSEHPIRSFSTEIQSFSDIVQQAILISPMNLSINLSSCKFESLVSRLSS